MSRWLEFVNWIAIFPYGYLVFFLGTFVGASPKTPQAVGIFFWGYLAVFPLTVIVFNLMAREARRVGLRGRALLWTLVPWGVLAVTAGAFPAFVNLLVACFE